MSSYLSFKIGEEVFAVNVSRVIEIVEMPPITSVPQAPPFMRGVINLRGSVLPVINTRIKFGLEAQADTINTCIVVIDVHIEQEDVRIGIVADAVQEVFELREEEMIPPPRVGNKYKADFIKGLGRSDEKFILILDVDKVFTTSEASLLADTQNELETIK